VDALHGDSGIVSDGDTILALSYSGESEELLNLLPALKRFSVKIVAMTGAPKSALARYSDLVLSVRVPKEVCPFNLAPTASTTAMLVMGDALAMAVLKARGFKQQDFAKFHPSGAIGRAMLSRVADIMRSGSRNAVAEEDLDVKEALLVMTQAKSRSLSVVNRRGKLATLDRNVRAPRYPLSARHYLLFANCVDGASRSLIRAPCSRYPGLPVAQAAAARSIGRRCSQCPCRR